MFLFIFQLNGYCQNKGNFQVFFDENNKPIEIDKYYKKCSAFVFVCKKQNVDSIQINSITKMFLFDKLTEVEYNQFILHLKLRNKISIGTNKTIIISYRRVLKKIEKGHLSSQNKSTSIRQIKNIERSHLSSQKNYDIEQKKCFKQFKRDNIIPIYLYKNNINYTYMPKNFSWQQISLNVGSIFNNPNILDDHLLIVLKPNGEYFTSNHIIPSPSLKKIINPKTWNQAKLDLESSISVNSAKGVGVFSEIYNYRKTYTTTRKFIIKPNSKQINPRIQGNTVTVKSKEEMQKYIRSYKPSFSTRVHCF